MKSVSRKMLSVVLIIIMLTMMMTSCSNGEDKSSGENSGKTVIYGSGDYTAINPAIKEHGEINSLLFTGLMKHDVNNNVVLDMAKKYTLSEDKKVYTFEMRDDLTFHDGKPVTVEDVQFTLLTILDTKNGSEIVSNYEDIKDIQVIGKNKIDITLNAPNTAFLDYMTIGILPKHLLEGKDVVTDVFNQKPIGSGPYKLTEWDMGQSITLEKFEDYYNGAAKIDTIIFKIVEDTDARALQIKSGELDFAQITPKAAKEVESVENYSVISMKTADYRGILYNFKNEFFKENRELPNILSYAIDRQAIIDTVLLGHGVKAYSPLQAGPYNNANVEKFEYAPGKAKALLEEAGWVMGEKYYEKNGKELGFTINNGQGDQVRIDMAKICAQNLQNIGVNAKVKVNAETDWAGQEAYLIGWGSPFDPDDHTYKVFGTDKGANYSGYSNGRVDELLTQARSYEKQDERMNYYTEFQQEITKDMPYTFIAYIDAIYIANDKITGITPEKILGHHGVGVFWNVEDWDII